MPITNYDDIVAKSLRVTDNPAVVASLGAPVIADVDRYVVSVNLTNVALTVAAQPDVPRNITMTVVDSTPGITAGTVTVVGEGPDGEAITEVQTFTGAATKTGTKIFAKIDSITASGFTALGGGGDETIVVGCGNVIGLPTDIIVAGAVKHVYLGGTRVASPTVAVGEDTSGVDASGSTYNGTKVLQVWYNPSL